MSEETFFRSKIPALLHSGLPDLTDVQFTFIEQMSSSGSFNSSPYTPGMRRASGGEFIASGAYRPTSNQQVNRWDDEKQSSHAVAEHDSCP